MRKWTTKFMVGIHTCEMTFTEKRGLKAVWSPDIPPGKLRLDLLPQYRAGRDAFLQQISDDLGGNVLVVEV